MLFISLMSHEMIGQSTLEILGEANFNVGNASLQWSMSNHDAGKGYKAKSYIGNIGAAVSLHKMYECGKSIGIQFNRMNSSASLAYAKQSISDKLTENHISIIFLKETFSGAESRFGQVFSLSAGYSRMIAKGVDSYLLDYSTPYDYTAKWNGFIAKFDMGVRYKPAKANSKFHFCGSFQYNSSTLGSLKRDIDSAPLTSKSTLKYFTVGFNVGFVFMIKKKE